MKNSSMILLALIGLLNAPAQGQKTNLQTASYTLASTDAGNYLNMDCSAACVLTLPNPSTLGVAFGQTLTFRILSTGSITPTVVVTSGTVNGSSTIPLLSTNQQGTLIYTDGTNWVGDNWNTLSAKVISGVSYSAMYPQNSLELRVNACISDAETGSNGNTTHICSSVGEAASQTQHGTIAVGNTSSQQVEWRLPAYCQWNLYSTTAFSGANYGLYDQIDLYDGGSIVGTGPVNGCVFINGLLASTAGQTYANLRTKQGSSSGGVYVKAQGFVMQNGTFSGAAQPTASGHDVVIGFTTDSSLFSSILLEDYTPGQIPWQVGDVGASTSANACCTVSMQQIQVDGNYDTGPLMQITGNNTINVTNGVSCFNCSLDHPGPGYSNVVISDTSTEHGTHFSFYNLYEEGPENTVFTITGVSSVSGGNTTYTGTITGGAGTAWPATYHGSFIVSGDATNASNNGTFTYVSSTATTLTLANASGVADSFSGYAAFNIPLNTAAGANTIDIFGEEIKGESGSNNPVPAWELTGTFPTRLNLHGHTSPFGFIFPMTVVENDVTGTNVKSDLYGSVSTYIPGATVIDNLTAQASTANLEVAGAPYSAGTGKTNWGSLVLGTPAAIGAASILNTNGTYVEIAEPSGSASDFLRCLNNNVSECQLSSGGAFTLPGYFYGTGASSYLRLYNTYVSPGSSGEIKVGTTNGGTNGTIDTGNVNITPCTITSSATPTIPLASCEMQTLTLSANVTSVTLTGLIAGSQLKLQICQPSSGGPYTFAYPSAMHGGTTIGTTAGDCTMQAWASYNGSTLVPLSAGIINVAP